MNICRPSACWAGMKSRQLQIPKFPKCRNGFIQTWPFAAELASTGTELKGGPCLLRGQCAPQRASRHSENNPVAFTPLLFLGLATRGWHDGVHQAAFPFSCSAARLAFYSRLCRSSKTAEQTLSFGTRTCFPLQRSPTGVSGGSPDCAVFLDVTCVPYA